MRIRWAVVALLALSVTAPAVPASARIEVREADANLRIALEVRERLADRGITVLMTRTDDRTLRPSDRTGLANVNRTDAFVSIHNNASTSRRPSGTIVFRSLRDDGSVDLGDAIRDRFRAEFGPERRAQLTTRRGCCGDYYYQLRRPQMPAALVEAAFVSNPAEGKALATDPAFRARIADAIAAGIIDFQATINATAARERDPGIVLSGTHVPPSEVRATPLGGTRVALEWLAPEGGAKRYRIYRDGVLVADVRTAPGERGSWVDRTATPQTLYRYQVRATERALDAGVKIFRESAGVPLVVETPAMTIVLDPGHGGRDPGAVRTY